jgi:hypothetical protein
VVGVDVSQRAVVKFLNVRGRLPVHLAGLYTMLLEDFSPRNDLIKCMI